MSVKVWVRELEELKGIPILEGELEWIISVIDDDPRSKQEDCFPTKTEDDEQE